MKSNRRFGREAIENFAIAATKMLAGFTTEREDIVLWAAKRFCAMACLQAISPAAAMATRWADP
jgi:hypothetical protein